MSADTPASPTTPLEVPAADLRWIARVVGSSSAAQGVLHEIARRREAGEDPRCYLIGDTLVGDTLIVGSEMKTVPILPSTRQEALRIGVDRYFTGEPCKAGHLELRYAKNSHCVTCARNYAARWTKAHKPQRNTVQRRRYAVDPAFRNRKLATAEARRARRLCGRCGGSGTIDYISPLTNSPAERPCPRCDGMGKEMRRG
jgi:hypothetical protein